MDRHVRRNVVFSAQNLTEKTEDKIFPFSGQHLKFKIIIWLGTSSRRFHHIHVTYKHLKIVLHLHLELLGQGGTPKIQNSEKLFLY